MFRCFALLPGALMLVGVSALHAQTLHRSYFGNDPSQWTVTAIEPAQTPANSPEWTVLVSERGGYRIAQIVADAVGNTYVAGYRLFTSGEPVSLTDVPVSDAFIAKLDPSGSLVFLTTLSGKGTDRASCVAVDKDGNVYVAGSTTSQNFPLRNAIDSTPSGSFLTKLSPTGTIVYSTYIGLGGRSAYTHTTGITAIASDLSGAVYIANEAYTTGLGYQSYVVVAKLAPAGDRVTWQETIRGYLITGCNGGSSCSFTRRYTDARALALDRAGNVYLLGNTDTVDVGTAGSYRQSGIGPFIAKFKADGSGRSWTTYLASGYTAYPQYPTAASPKSAGYGFAIDAEGNCFIAGGTSDPNFPFTEGAYRTKQGNGFVAKLSADGTRLVWSTLLESAGTALTLDASGDIWITGLTSGADFPNENGWSQGGDFLIALDPTGSKLHYSARYPDESVRSSLAAGTAGLIHTAGQTGTVSVVAPKNARASRVFSIANAANGPVSGRIAPGEVVSIYGPGIGPNTAISATADGAGLPTALGGVRVLVNGLPAALLYVSASQINAVVPFGLAREVLVGEFEYPATVSVEVTKNGVRLPAFTIPVTAALPQVFRSNGNYAAALNEDGSVNSAANPAKGGSVVTVWVSGAGTRSSAKRIDGAVEAEAQNTYCCKVSTFSVAKGTTPTPTQVLYSGPAPGMVAGIAQVNFRLPSPLITGVTTWNAIVVAGTESSNSVAIYVKN